MINMRGMLLVVFRARLAVPCVNARALFSVETGVHLVRMWGVDVYRLRLVAHEMNWSEGRACG